MAEVYTPCFRFRLRLAPRFHRRRWLGKIGSLRTTGKSEEGTAPVTATDIRGQLSGDHVSPKNKKKASAVFYFGATESMRRLGMTMTELVTPRRKRQNATYKLA